jgi:hypothetical protein
MTNALKLIALALVAIVVSIFAGIQLHARFFDYIALFAVSLIIMVAILVHRETRRSKGEKVANVGWYIFGLLGIYFLVATGYQLNFAPPTYEYSSCKEFYSIVRKENAGCLKSDFQKTLRLERHVASGVSFDKRLRQALESDLDEAYRAERTGEFITPPFPRLQQVWGEYRAAQANQAIERMLGHWSTGVIIFVMIFVGFVINGALSLKKIKVIGGGQVVVGAVMAVASWLFWNFQDITLSNYLPLSAGSLKVISDYWYVGIALGVTPLVLPLFNDLADFFKEGVFVKKALIVGVPALALTAGLLLSPNLVGIMMLPSIFKSLLANQDLSIQVIQLGLFSGLLLGMGIVTLIEGIVKLINPAPEKPAS